MNPPEIQENATDDQNSLGRIRINHSVIRSIVRLAALEVEGVCSIATGFVDQLGGISEIFSKKESDRGVKVQEDDEQNYNIEIRLILAYGCDIPKTATDVQVAVRNRIAAMIGQNVVKVDVIVDGIRQKDPPKPEKEAKDWSGSTETG